MKIQNIIILKTISYLCFAISNGIIKYLVDNNTIYSISTLPIYTIIIFSYSFGIFLFIPKIIIKKKYTIKHHKIHFFRIFISITGFLLWCISFKFIPIIQIIAISLISPIITIIISLLFFEKKITNKKILSLSICIIGTILISINPIQNIHNSNTTILLLPLLATILFVIDKIISKKLMILKESSTSFTFYLLISSIPVYIIASIIYGWKTPGIEHMPWLIILGFLSIISNYTYIKAYKYAEITTLIPFYPLKMIFGSIIGFMFFNENPKIFEIMIGSILIIISYIILIYKKD